MNVHQSRDSSLVTLPWSFKRLLLTTPPESFMSLPLTPPPSQGKSKTSVLETILREIKNREKGRNYSEQPWQRFELDENGYKTLQQSLEDDDYARNKLRYDYFPSIKQFVLRMPSVLHELVSGEVVREITRQLDSITSYEDESAQFARNITSSASGVIKLPDPEYGRHDPDASFGYLRTRYPGVVIEVSYSQKRKDLPYLADEYILGSNGNIRVVIGLDVEYRGKMATLSIWRPRFSINGDGDEELEAEQTVVNQRFRDENGKPDLNSEADLNLRLEDFAPEIIVKSFTNLQKHISISSQNLCAYLDVAEALNLTRNHEGGVETPVRANLKKRKREKTPPEELEPEREARFRKEEERVAKRIMRDDPDYSASSVSGSDPDSS